MIELYEYPPSGNSYKVRLLLQELGREFKAIHVDILNGESRTPEFLDQLSPNGRIPVVRFEDGRTLWESVAILWHLAEGTELLPDEPWGRAKVLQWMAFEQYNIEPNIAVARFQLHSLHKSPDDLGETYDNFLTKGHEALAVLEDALKETPWLVGDFSIADIALYGYVHVAHEGGFDLSDYPAIRNWIHRIEQRPAWTPIGG